MCAVLSNASEVAFGLAPQVARFEKRSHPTARRNAVPARESGSGGGGLAASPEIGICLQECDQPRLAARIGFYD